MRALVRAHGLTPADVLTIDLTVDPTFLGVCNIAVPETGMQSKLSLKATAAMALLGDLTAEPAAFDDARARDPTLRTWLERITAGCPWPSS